MAASPEFYKPTAAFSSPCASFPDEDSSCYYSSSSCRTPTGSGISYLKEPTTCPPAPRKPPPPPPLCKKRLFQSQPVISLRLDELERIFRPKPDKKAKKDHQQHHQQHHQQQQLGFNSTELNSSKASTFLPAAYF